MGKCVTLQVQDMGGHPSAPVELEAQIRDGDAAAHSLGCGVSPQALASVPCPEGQTPWNHP